MNKKAVDYLASLSDEECAELDKAGIKILGIEFEYDDNDRSWASD